MMTISRPSSRRALSSKSRSMTSLLDLPGDVQSHIASFLDLPDQLSFLSSHPDFLSLARTHLSPLSSSIRRILDDGPPYPNILAKIPTLNLFLPLENGHLFVDVLVRARPRWILERFELGRWPERVWREAFERRFLPSWRRFKGENDTWRAIFLRTLGRLEHRNLGCTHEESWTRFITLNRNGSGSINRMYSRLFDPYDIYDELKHQNNFASQPTQVRVVVHLQDVRILAIGVLLSSPSLFVNPNAHLLLHPPLLRQIPMDLSDIDDVDVQMTVYDAVRSSSPPQIRTRTREADSSDSEQPVLPIPVKSGRARSPVEASGSSPRIRNTLAALIPGRGRRSSNGANGQSSGAINRQVAAQTSTGRSLDNSGGPLNRIRSRETGDQGRRRGWSLSLPRSRNMTVDEQVPSAQSSSSSEMIVEQHITALSASFGHVMTAVPEVQSNPPADAPSRPREISSPPRPQARSSDAPYPILTHPQPNGSHRFYPNHTPPHFLLADGMEFMDSSAPPASDTRARHSECEDDGIGMLWSAGEAHWGDDGSKMAEIDSRTGLRSRWVGPMILVAQLHPCDRSAAHPSGASPYGPLEGQNVDLGPKGMYTSIGFEDLEVVAPWVELKAGGGNSSEARRDFLS
ncbi:hypothetical protein BD324DRAFT_622801 [Kockovaella imperatae]|uniref:F-box domain-containing protein n=1 Tax=Kockovaella imperatae TaxID=4999 RepID=A0A1Y1UHX9_9TREE|nr:hypothetical protein BD324DRAFT_622801 [Kockovaella imperatae]ORX37661.1 hypothetical protein BD324DRAFT_622801 [Kockovaella imperatae]